jgi:hypothetical protein
MTTTPLTDQQLADRIATAIWERQNPGRSFADCEPRWQADAVADANAVLAVVQPEVDRLAGELGRVRAELDAAKAELAEEKAKHDPRLRCLLVKAAPDQDLYIGWSNISERPSGAWTRAEALAYGFPPSRLNRADETGTSSQIGDGAWSDSGFIAEQRGWLRRDRLGDYAAVHLDGNREAAYALLEPFDDEPDPAAAVPSA